MFSTQLLLQLLPNEMRGRVFSSEFAIFTLMSAAAAGGVGGALDSPLGITGTLFAMAGLTLIPLLLWAVWLRLRLSRGVPAGSETVKQHYPDS